LEVSIDAKRHELKYAQSYERKSLKNEYNSLHSQLSSQNSFIQSDEGQLAEVLKPPASILCPIPTVDAYAQVALFNLCMPEDLAILGSISHLAQRSLLPNELDPNTASLIKVSSNTTSWVEVYEKYGSLDIPKQKEVILHAISYSARECFGPSSVDDIERASDCTWQPDFESGMLDF
jgi:hypothetical protein